MLHFAVSRAVLPPPPRVSGWLQQKRFATPIYRKSRKVFSLPTVLKLHKKKVERTERRDLRRRVVSGEQEAPTPRIGQKFKYKHCSAGADRKREIRDLIRKTMREVSGPYSIKQLVDMYNNPQVPAERKPPKELMDLYFHFEKKTHLNVKPGELSLRAMRRRVVPSNTAKTAVDEEMHGWKVQRFKPALLVRKEIAPVNRASEKAQVVFGRKAKVFLSTAAANIASVPEPSKDIPEVLIMGRSNVGKSTIINALFNRPVTDTSAQRGSTRHLLFFHCGVQREPNLSIVDSPGLLSAPEMGSTGDRTDKLIMDYIALRTRQGILRLVVFVVEANRMMGSIERERLDALDQLEIPFVVIMNKSDTTTRRNLMKAYTQNEQYTLQWKRCRGMFLVSTHQLLGVSKLQSLVADFSRIPQLGSAKPSDFSMGDLLPLPAKQRAFVEKCSMSRRALGLKKFARRLQKQAAKEKAAPLQPSKKASARAAAA